MKQDVEIRHLRFTLDEDVELTEEVEKKLHEFADWKLSLPLYFQKCPNGKYAIGCAEPHDFLYVCGRSIKELLKESVTVPDEIDPDTPVYLILGTKPEELTEDDWSFIEAIRHESAFVYWNSKRELVIDDS